MNRPQLAQEVRNELTIPAGSINPAQLRFNDPDSVGRPSVMLPDQTARPRGVMSSDYSSSMFPSPSKHADQSSILLQSPVLGNPLSPAQSSRSSQPRGTETPSHPHILSLAEASARTYLLPEGVSLPAQPFELGSQKLSTGIGANYVEVSERPTHQRPASSFPHTRDDYFQSSTIPSAEKNQWITSYPQTQGTANYDPANMPDLGGSTWHQSHTEPSPPVWLVKMSKLSPYLDQGIDLPGDVMLDGTAGFERRSLILPSPTLLTDDDTAPFEWPLDVQRREREHKAAQSVQTAQMMSLGSIKAEQTMPASEYGAGFGGTPAERQEAHADFIRNQHDVQRMFEEVSGFTFPSTADQLADNSAELSGTLEHNYGSTSAYLTDNRPLVAERVIDSPKGPAFNVTPFPDRTIRTTDELTVRSTRPQRDRKMTTRALEAKAWHDEEIGRTASPVPKLRNKDKAIGLVLPATLAPQASSTIARPALNTPARLPRPKQVKKRCPACKSSRTKCDPSHTGSETFKYQA